MIRRLVTLAIATLLTAPAVAQQPGYRFSARDTLRYREITKSEIVLRPPQGPATLTSEHDATIALVRGPGDTATAWYQQLTLSSASPFGEKRPNTESALRQPFRLTLSSSGVVKLLSVPTFAAEVAAQTDLSHQFDDFFISVPTAALRPNGVWSDTLTSATAATAEEKSSSRHIRRFRVLRDTVVAGAPAVVIAVDQEVDIQSSSPLKSQPVVIDTHIQGQEEGFAVFGTRVGRLLSRHRRGHLEGQQVLKRQGAQMTVPMTVDYSSSLVLLPATP